MEESLTGDNAILKELEMNIRNENVRYIINIIKGGFYESRFLSGL